MSGATDHLPRLLALVPWLVYKHHRMRVHEREEERYALVNDGAHGYVLVHYYVTPADQARQFADEGFELVESLDEQGARIAEGDDAAASSEILPVQTFHRRSRKRATPSIPLICQGFTASSGPMNIS